MDVMVSWRDVSFSVRLKKILLGVFSPGWRPLAIVIGTGLLFASAHAVAPAQGTLSPVQSIRSLVFSLAAFMSMWIASRPVLPRWFLTMWNDLPGYFRWRVWGVLIIGILLFYAWGQFTYQFKYGMLGRYYSDAIAYVHMDADLVRQGKNPFTDTQAYWQAVVRWPQSLSTPMLGSPHFGDNPLKYPSTANMSHELQYEATHPAARTGNFDPQTVHNYPAGIIWLALPFIWAGLSSVNYINLIALAILIGIILSRTHDPARLAFLIAALANPIIPMFSLFANFDLVALVFVVAAWNWMRKEKTSAILLGIGCAVKQVSWFFIPFYLLQVIREEGWQAAIRRSFWLGITFIIINLPFIITSPVAWFHSLWIPISDPMFPVGFGPITLALSGMMPIVSPHLWTILELGSMAILLGIQWRRGDRNSDGLILALIPLWFSWRSQITYFAAWPLLVAWVAAQYSYRMPVLPRLLWKDAEIQAEQERSRSELIQV